MFSMAVGAVGARSVEEAASASTGGSVVSARSVGGSRMKLVVPFCCLLLCARKSMLRTIKLEPRRLNEEVTMFATVSPWY